jgi:hypothetical protein
MYLEYLEDQEAESKVKNKKSLKRRESSMSFIFHSANSVRMFDITPEEDIDEPEVSPAAFPIKSKSLRFYQQLAKQYSGKKTVKQNPTDTQTRRAPNKEYQTVAVVESLKDDTQI